MNHIEYLDKTGFKPVKLNLSKELILLRDYFQHITHIKGISALSAILIVSEIGTDMNQFESDKQLINWAGLSPANNESANKKKIRSYF